MIKNRVTSDLINRKRTFELCADSLEAYANLSKAARKLLMDIIQRIGAGLDVQDLIVTGDYSDFGFERSQHFSKYRKELVDTGFIVYQGKDHYVSPLRIRYTSRRQLDYLHRLFKLKREKPVNMGQLDYK